VTHKARALPIHQVYPNPNQPRKVFAADSLAELAGSIVANGLIQPITVVTRKCPAGRYLIVAGERRWRAHLLVKLKEIQAIVRDDLTDAQVAEHALVENLLREDLGIVEEARAYQEFMGRGYTIDSLATMLGMQQSWRIQERLNVLKLDGALLEGLIKGAVTASQAQELSRLSVEGQYTLWRAIQDGKCATYSALRRMASAILDDENQQDLFKADLTKRDKLALTKVDRFLKTAARLVSILDREDMELMNRIQKSNARACADQLGLVEKICRDLRNVLLGNAARQEISKPGSVSKPGYNEKRTQ
jgi:ParB family chromosome partitioning protein